VGEVIVRRCLVLAGGLIYFSFALASVSQAQTAARTVRVVTNGGIGTVQTLTVATAGTWRLIDLDDHRLLREGTGSAEWRFALGESSRLLAVGDGARLEAGSFRLEGEGAEPLFTVSAGRRARVYPGAVEVVPARGGAGTGLRLINEAPIEAYLRGVVAAEGSASFQPEALKALAIAARSYAERNRLRHDPVGELCDTVHCQVYPGVGRVPEKVARAVADTAGVVGLYSGAVIDAVFSADCGGRTRNNEDVWPSRAPIAYLRSVEDRPPAGGPDYCSVYRNHLLRLKLSPLQLGRLVGLSTSDPGRVILEGIDRDGSGRVAALRVGAVEPQSSGQSGVAPRKSTADELEAGEEPLPCEQEGTRASGRAAGTAATARPTDTRQITLTQIRRLFGDQLRGRLADATASADGGLELECRGLGHGVGLCQWGAQGMALPPYNHTCEEILQHYYRGITLGSAPPRTAALSLQLSREDGQPLAEADVRLLPSGPAGKTDTQGRWVCGSTREGTYAVAVRQGAETLCFYGVRVAVRKSDGARLDLALVWRTRDPRVARLRTRAAGG
jgi:SpoIID/LytB domain protein